MGYQIETTDLLKGKGFWKRRFLDETAKEEVRSRFNERISQLQSEWTLITSNENNALMIDEAKNVKSVTLYYGEGLFGGGPCLGEATADDNYIKYVRIKMNPPHVSGVRDAGDAVTNPHNKRSVSIFVIFGAGGFKNDLNYDVVNEKKIPINIENLERVVAKAQRELILIRSFFGDKIDQDETAGPRMMV